MIEKAWKILNGRKDFRPLNYFNEAVRLMKCCYLFLSEIIALWLALCAARAQAVDKTEFAHQHNQARRYAGILHPAGAASLWV